MFFAPALAHFGSFQWLRLWMLVMNRYQQKHRGYQVQQAASAPQPNCLVKLTPTGSACWYPPLRSGAAYRGRKTATLAGARFPGGRAQVPWALAPCAARAAGCGGHEERLFLHGVTVTRRTGKWLNAEKARAAPEAGFTHRRLAGVVAAKGAPAQRSVIDPAPVNLHQAA